MARTGRIRHSIDSEITSGIFAETCKSLLEDLPGSSTFRIPSAAAVNVARVGFAGFISASKWRASPLNHNFLFGLAAEISISRGVRVSGAAEAHDFLLNARATVPGGSSCISRISISEVRAYLQNVVRQRSPLVH